MSNKGLISKIYKQFIQLNVKKTTMLQDGQKTWVDIFPKGSCRWPTAHIWHCFSSGKCKSKRQNHNEVSPHNCQNGFHKKEHKTKCWQGYGEKRTLVHCWWEFDLVQAEVYKKTKNGTMVWLSNSTPDYISPPKSNNSKRYMHSNIHSSLIYSCQDRKAT